MLTHSIPHPNTLSTILYKFTSLETLWVVGLCGAAENACLCCTARQGDASGNSVCPCSKKFALHTLVKKRKYCTKQRRRFKIHKGSIDKKVKITNTTNGLGIPWWVQRWVKKWGDNLGRQETPQGVSCCMYLTLNHPTSHRNKTAIVLLAPI